MEILKGKNALVFGGNGGISRAINNELLKNGIKNLLLVDINQDQSYIDQLKTKFRDCKIIFEKGDISQKETVKTIFKKYFDEFGYIDFLVNSAGIINEQNIEMTYQVNILGPIHACLEALEYMGKHKGGKGGIIINIASNAGLDGFGLIPIYASTKHALVGFSKSLMDQKVSKMSGIKIICLCPAVTKTPMSASEYSSLFPELSQYMEDFRAYDVAQSPEAVSEAMILALNDDSEGSVWTIINGTIEKLDVSNKYT